MNRGRGGGRKEREGESRREPVMSLLPTCKYGSEVVVSRDHAPSPTPSGSDVTVVGYGAQIQTLREASRLARAELGVACELIDLRTLLPWDVDTVANVRIPYGLIMWWGSLYESKSAILNLVVNFIMHMHARL